MLNLISLISIFVTLFCFIIIIINQIKYNKKNIREQYANQNILNEILENTIKYACDLEFRLTKICNSLNTLESNEDELTLKIEKDIAAEEEDIEEKEDEEIFLKNEKINICDSLEKDEDYNEYSFQIENPYPEKNMTFDFDYNTGRIRNLGIAIDSLFDKSKIKENEFNIEKM